MKWLLQLLSSLPPNTRRKLLFSLTIGLKLRYERRGQVRRSPALPSAPSLAPCHKSVDLKTEKVPHFCGSRDTCPSIEMSYFLLWNIWTSRKLYFSRLQAILIWDSNIFKHNNSSKNVVLQKNQIIGNTLIQEWEVFQKRDLPSK